MKIESTEFTEETFYSIISDYLEHERRQLLARLRNIPDEADSLVPSIEGRSESDEKEWSAVETLAHMAISAQFFGWLVHEIATKKEIQGNILELLKMRDPTMIDAVKTPPVELASQLRSSIERTVEFIEKVPYDDLRTRIQYLGREMTGEDVLRISLCGHLEDHVEQIRKALQ